MIPFSKPYLGKEEEDAVIDVLRSGQIACGKKSREFEEKFAKYMGAKYAVYTNGGTAALWMAVNVSDMGPEIHIPSTTYTATASIIVEQGKTPVFEDIDIKDMCMKQNDPNNSIVVHLTGNRAKSTAKIYDSAHRLERNDIKDDSIWCYSFWATKLITTGHGGMAATNNKEYYEKMRLIQDDGRSGEKPFYKITQAVGGKDQSDINAAIGIEQLKKLPEMNKKRDIIVNYYNKQFGLDRTGRHLYYIFVNDRPKFLKLMENKGIQVSVHFQPLHKMPAYEKYCDKELPVSDWVGEHIVSLPLFPSMTIEDAGYVSKEVLDTNLLIRQ